jgi:hypothetical protein
MRSKLLTFAAIASLGVCSLLTPSARAANPKAKAAAEKAAEKKKAAELHADDKAMRKQMGWEDKVMGPDDKRAELEKIARANAINEKAAKEREKQAAIEAAAPKAPVKASKNEMALPATAEEKKLNETDGKAHEISPKLASEAARAPVPASKPADDKFIDKLLKEEQPSKKKASATASDRELDALLAGAKDKPSGHKRKGDVVDEMIKSADKGPAMPAPRSTAALPEWTKQPEIASTPAPTPPPAPAPVAAKPAPKQKDDGVIHVVQGAAVQSATPAPAPVAARATTTSTSGRKKGSKAAPVVWNDPFADKKPIASRDHDAPAPRKEPTSRPAPSAEWNDPFADAPEPKRSTRRAAPAAPPVVAPASTPKRGEKTDPSARPAGWKDPFTKAPRATSSKEPFAKMPAPVPAHAPVAMREPVKGESSKWEIAARRSPVVHASASESHVGGWGVIKKRGR